MIAINQVDTGVLLVAATALIWPAVGALYLALRGEARLAAWAVFLRIGLVAVGAAAMFFAGAYAMIATNGTSQSMASLGPQIAALTCLGGAALCGLVALVLRLRR